MPLRSARSGTGQNDVVQPVATSSSGSGGGTGPQGPVGPAGPPGDPGADGADGAAGATGPAGADGADGAPGADGPPGAAGADGATGAPGPAGASWAVYSATVSTANQLWVESVVSHPGMTSAALLRAWLKPGDDFDENNGEAMPETTVAARGSTDQVTLTLMSGTKMSGPIKIAYEVLG